MSRMSAKAKIEHDRIKKAFDQIISKFDLDLNLSIRPMTPGQLKRYPKTYFTIERSNRSKEDRNTFLVTFNQTNMEPLTLSQIRRHALHETLHAVTWPFVDEFEEVVKYLKDQSDLYGELCSRAYDTRENVIYTLERKLGPVLLPEAEWDETKDGEE